MSWSVGFAHRGCPSGFVGVGRYRGGVVTERDGGRRSLKFLLRPTARQVVALVACLEDHRTLYNAALEHRRTAYAQAGVTVRYGDQSAELTHIRGDDPGGQGRFDTVEWPKDGDGCRWDPQPEHPTATYVRLQGVGHVRVHRHRPVKGRVKTISVKREGSRWYLVLSCDEVPAGPLPATGVVAGIDLGVASLVTTSDGEHVANPRHLIATAERLAQAQRDLARKRRGSQHLFLS